MKRRSSSDTVVVKGKTRIPKERHMNQEKYIGMDVHKATTVIAVLNNDGKIVAEGITETKGSTILDFIKAQRGTVHVTFEEGTQAAWLYDLIRPHVARVIVCDPRKIKEQNHKADKPDARLLAELLRINALNPVYHGERSSQAVKQLTASYVSIVNDGTRVKNRIKALFRGRGIDCEGGAVYDEKDREEWLQKLPDPGVRKRASRLYKELDFLLQLRAETEKDLVAEARKHPAIRILKSVPGIGSLRAAMILGIAATPDRFRTKKQFWSYCGLAVRSKISAEYELVHGRICKAKKHALVRGLNTNYNRSLKQVFKGAAATMASTKWRSQFEAMVAGGTDPSLVLLTLARKLASITLAIWRKGELYSEKKLKFKHAV
jgi:transposase